MANTIAGITALATLVEGLIEYFVVPLMEEFNAAKYAKYIALLVAVGLCIAYKIDILEMLLGLETSIPYVGEILAGTVVGRGANYVNDFVDYLRSLATIRLR